MIRGHHHLAGIGGVGMSALARALAGHGAEVTGSDRFLDAGQPTPALEKLRRAGFALAAQDGSALRPDTRALVLSTAIEKDNAEVRRAAELGVPVVHRAEMLARLVGGGTCIAVTGTAGKTTVTGLVGWVLECAGMNPSVVNGGAVVNWVTDTELGNARIGSPHLWVIEADESDRSLLQFEPDWAVITNISKDHFELDEVTALFRQFAGRVRRGVVGCFGEPPAEKLLAGFAPRLTAQGSLFQHRGEEYAVPLLGRHNAENALEAVELCLRLGLEPATIRNALAGFRGIERRLEPAGTAAGISVIDDYAHNPAKIRAALTALAPYHGRILAAWRPHGYGPLALMKDELLAMFAETLRPPDMLFVLPVFYAGGTARRVFTSGEFVEALRARGLRAEYAPDFDALEARLARQAEKGDAILVMGARDPGLPAFARRLVSTIGRRVPGA